MGHPYVVAVVMAVVVAVVGPAVWRTGDVAVARLAAAVGPVAVVGLVAVAAAEFVWAERQWCTLQPRERETQRCKKEREG